MVTFCFSVGNIEEAVTSPTGQAYIQVFYTATKSRSGATAMSSIVTLLTFFNAVNNVASASRQLYAFARDNGLPFSSFLSYVRVYSPPLLDQPQYTGSLIVAQRSNPAAPSL